MRIEDLHLEKPRQREVLVRVMAAGVCHTDLHYMHGDLQCPLPVVPGHEGAGIVEDVGPGVTTVRVGDPVILMWRPRCGRCRYCAVGRPALCEATKIQKATGGLLDGTSRLRLGSGRDVKHLLGVACFAERCVVAEESVISIPPDIPFPIASIVGCAVITGLGAVLNVAKEVAGSSVLVLGAGGVGLSSVLGAALLGAHTIIAADVVPARLALAKRLGATHTIDVRTSDLTAAVTDICPEGVDWAFEAVGRPSILEQALSCLRIGGTLVAIGLGKVGETFRVGLNELVQQEKRVIGSLYGSANTTVDIPRLLALYQAGKLPLQDLLGDSYALDDVNDACQALVEGATGRAVIVPAD